jgi:hypothetical protein
MKKPTTRKQPKLLTIDNHLRDFYEEQIKKFQEWNSREGKWLDELTKEKGA